MYFAQTAYNTQKLGNSNLTIAEAGCFITADSDLLAKVGITAGPPTLDNFFQSHNLFSYDAKDHANDDITWSTVTHYCPQLVVNQVGGAGFPNSDLAIVEFRYKDNHGEEVTHFCCVNSASDHSIIDSWNGKVKTPAEHPYGQPIAWATYTYHTPATIPSSLPPAAPISAPHAVTASASVAPPAAPHELFLPPSVSVWHVYNPGGPYTLPHATHVLDPKMYGGLTYQILGSPAPHIYLIKTQMYGEVAIYAGPDTVAQFPGTGHGEGESTDATPPTTGIPVSEVVSAPVLSAPVAPEVTPPAEPAVTYTRFGDPMDLVTKDGAQSVNFISGTIVDNLSTGTPFTAVGKATLANNDTYYMNESNFGKADETQTTPITVGIKTVFLTEAPKVETAPESGQQASVASPALSGTSTIVNFNPTVPTAAPDPAFPWQRTMKFSMNPQPYLVKEDIKIVDFATVNDETPATTIVKAGGKPIDIGGKFIFGGSWYYRAQSSIDKGTWYGFPVTSLVKQDASNTPFNIGDDIDQIGSEAQQEISKTKHAAIKAAATSSTWLERLNIKRGRS